MSIVALPDPPQDPVLEYGNVKDELTALRKALEGEHANPGEYSSIQAELQAIRKAVENGAAGGGGGCLIVNASQESEEAAVLAVLDRTAGEILQAFQNGTTVLIRFEENGGEALSFAAINAVECTPEVNIFYVSGQRFYAETVDDYPSTEDSSEIDQIDPVA